MSVSLASLSIGSDDMPLTLATLEADAVELVAARLTADGAMALRTTCSALRLAIGEANWNSIANRAAARIEHQRSSGSVRAVYQMGGPSQEMVAAGQPQDSRERAAFRQMCSALTQECLDVVSTCFSLVSIECIPSGTAAEPSLVPEFYSKVMPVGQVPDAAAEAAFLALDAALSSLRTTEWWAAFAAGERRAHGYDSIAAHLERLVPPSGLRAALDAKAPAGGWGTAPVLLRAAATSAQYRAHWHSGSCHSSGRIHLQSLILFNCGGSGHKGGHLAQGLAALSEALQPRSAAERLAWSARAEAARVAAAEKERREQAALLQRQREQEAKEAAERLAHDKLARECKAAGLAPPKAASSNVDSDGYADWW